MSARLLGLAFALSLTAATGSFAQTRFVVPYTPGAANDTLARVLAQNLGAETGQPVLVDNRPGAGGHLAAEQVAHAAPDGKTLLVTTNGLLAIGPHLYRKLPYDPQKDLAPVIRFANVPYVLGVSPQLGIKTVGELIALAKAKPEQVNFASSGNGSVPHMCGELINLRAGVKMTHVPYKGGAQAMNDVMSGTVELYCGSIPSLIGFAQSGKITLLGVTSPKRSALLPDLPTLEEQGLHGVDVDSWVGLHAPGGTPPATIEKLYSQIAKLMATDDVRRVFLTQGAVPEALAPAEFGAKVREESDRWAPVVTASGATLD
jgi:tripartite-type tricarboxylate transporter receptor subunit TctC